MSSNHSDASAPPPEAEPGAQVTEDVRPENEAPEVSGPKEAAAEAAGEPMPASDGAATDVAHLIAQVDAERATAAEYLAQWQRTAADFSNFKRRNEQERAEMAKLFNASLVGQLLPVLDNFERALAAVPPDLADHAWIAGITLTEKQLRSALEKEGLSAIDAQGQPFDPTLHEAVAHEVSADHEDDTVIEEFQKGYKLHDRVLRPAMVKVSKRS